MVAKWCGRTVAGLNAILNFMRIYLFILLLFLVSCSGIKGMIESDTFDYEVSNYQLANIDTLVHIGCGYGFFDGIISSKYQKLHFILEDDTLSKYGDIIKKNLASKVKNSKYEPTFGTNSRIVFGSSDSIPLPTGKYERVLCRISFHCFKNREKMVTELARILSPTGTLIIVEKIGCFSGEGRKHCKEHSISKDEVIQSFSQLELVDSLPLLENISFLFKFKKRKVDNNIQQKLASVNPN